MLFNSVEFFFFFPLVTILYFVLPHRYRWAMLLLASCAFYMAFIWQYLAILAVTIVIDYWAGMLIEDSEGPARKRYLIASIISTCLVLFVFKYFNFFNDNVEAVARALGWNYPIETLKIALPIGLSFHTFQSLSYVIEVYRRNQKAERHFGIYSLYVMFYPQLVAGPIERPQNLLHQFREVHDFDGQRVADGLKLMAWGLFKKVVIADRMAIFVNHVYNDPTEFTGIPLIIATVFFAVQIYCDFSGYSDMAIGAAQVMGFRLMDNFNRPYYSRTISEFWKRWHISLSTWFRDYLYLPLGGNRVPRLTWYRNLMVTFLVSGFWHGANWTFIAWGGLHGAYLVLGVMTDEVRGRIRKALGIRPEARWYKLWRIAFTFALVCIGWVFFRAASIQDAAHILGNLTTGVQEQIVASLTNVNNARQALVYLGEDRWAFLLALAGILILQIVHRTQPKAEARCILRGRPAWMRWPIYYGLLLWIMVFGVFKQTQFIYFQF